MNNRDNFTHTTFPPRTDSVFRALRMGRHLCRQDGEDYYDLQRNERDYAAVFKALGYDLIHHDQGFYYFTGQSTLQSKRLRAATLFMLILFQDLEDNKFSQPQRSWERSLLDRRFAINELPHFTTAQRRMLMNAVGVTPEKLETKLLRFLTQLGVIEPSADSGFRFRTPVYRFVDLFLQFANDQQWQRQVETGRDEVTDEPTPDETGNAEAKDGDTAAEEEDQT